MVRHLLCLTIAGFVLGCALPAFAMLGQDRYSMTEKIGFAFYNLTRSTPDFKSWINNNPTLIEMTEEEREAFMQTNLYRLEEGFRLYQPDEDLIEVKALVPLKYPKVPENQPDSHSPLRTIQLVNSSYFPVSVGPNHIAVIPGDFEEYSRLPITRAQFKVFDAALSLKHARSNCFVLVKLLLRPNRADASRPTRLEGVDMWPMMADVASFEIWDKTGKVFLWSSVAPWYKETASQELLNLYGR